MNSKSMKKCLAVIPTLITTPDSFNTFTISLYQFLKLYDFEIHVWSLTEKGIYILNPETFKKSGIKESSRIIAEKAAKQGYDKLLLFVNRQHMYIIPPGLMCWFEFFPELESNQVPISELPGCLSNEQRGWIVWTKEIHPDKSKFVDFYIDFHSEILKRLRHDQKDRTGNAIEGRAQ